MKIITKSLIVCSLLINMVNADDIICDIVVIGGTASGVGAAITASREGKKVCFITRVAKIKAMGGMITSGLNFSDSGLPSCYKKSSEKPDWEKCSHYGLVYDGVIPHIDGKNLTTGLFDEYRINNDNSYNNMNSWGGIRHKPDIAGTLISDLFINEKNITFYTSYVVDSADIKDKKLNEITIKKINSDGNLSAGINIKGKYFIDATITGDLASKSDIEMTIGRESPEKYKEGFAGKLYWNPKKSEFLTSSPNVGEVLADKKVQAYSYFLTVKTGKPVILIEDTDAWKALTPSCSYDFVGAPSFSESWARKNGWSPGNKYFEVNVHPKGSDLQEKNSSYHSDNWEDRVNTENKHKKRALCFIQFWQENDEGISLATEFFKEGMPYRMYVRESQRMVGRYIFKEQDSTPYNLYEFRKNKKLTLRNADFKRVTNAKMNTSIGFTSYPMDSHAVSPEPNYNFSESKKNDWAGYHKGEGEFYLQNLTASGVIPLGTIVPKNVDNLLVTSAVSATHVGYGTLRMEPVRMGMGQVGAVVASLAIDKNVKNADDFFENDFIWNLQSRLIDKHKLGLFFFKDVPRDAWYNKYVQMFAIRGFLDAKDFYDLYEFRPNDKMTREEFIVSLMKIVEALPQSIVTDKKVCKKEAFDDISTVAEINKGYIKGAREKCIINGYEKSGNFNPKNPINRAEVATVIIRAFDFNVDPCLKKLFSDVEINAWYCSYVNSAKEEGLAQGKSKNGATTNEFKPAELINRAEAITILFRLIEKIKEITSEIK